MDKKKVKEEHQVLNEERKKSVWERAEARWAAKAKKEGWQYTPKPYVSETEKKAAARRERIAALKAELKQLLTDEEKEQLLDSIKADNIS